MWRIMLLLRQVECLVQGTTANLEEKKIRCLIQVLLLVLSSGELF